jgi:hypothetical protein
MVSGIPPVEAGVLSSTEEDGCMMVSGSPPVEATAELCRVGAAAELWATEVGSTTTSGMPPVEPGRL